MNNIVPQQSLMPKNTDFMELLKKYWWVLVIVAFVAYLWYENDKKSKKIKIEEED